MTDDLLNHKLDALGEDVREIKADVKNLSDEAPIHRIRALEDWKRGVTRFLVAAALLIIGAYITVLFR